VITQLDKPCWSVQYPADAYGEVHHDRGEAEELAADEDGASAVEVPGPCWSATCEECGDELLNDEDLVCHYPTRGDAETEAIDYDWTVEGDRCWCSSECRSKEQGCGDDLELDDDFPSWDTCPSCGDEPDECCCEESAP
jgi:hypothetical protein